MSPALRSMLLASFVCGLTALMAPGCSQQGEGERCDRAKTQNSDCDSGLVCIPKAQLLDESTDRCCPATVGNESDERCRRGGGTGAGGSPDTGETPSDGGEPAAAGGSGGASSEPDAGGNGGVPQEPSPNGGAPAAGASTGGAPDSGGAPPQVGGAAGAGGA